MELARCSGQGASSTRAQGLPSSCCPLRRTYAAPSVFGPRHRSSASDVSAAATTSGRSAGNFPADVNGDHSLTTDVSCRAILVAERQTVAAPTAVDAIAPPGTAHGAPASPKPLPINSIDVAVVGADVSGLAAALAAARANPGARVMLYDTASEPPTACDGGVLLSTNGLRALKAMDANLYNRITTELASPVLEALWFDLEGELVRRTQLGQPPVADPSSGTTGSSGRRRSALQRARSGPNGAAAAASNGAAADPHAASAPLVISLHDLREALAEALPEEVQIFGRHHLRSVEACPNGGSGGVDSVLRFAGSPNGAPVRAVRTQLLVGADGPQSAVKRLQFDGGQLQRHQELQQQATHVASGRVVWRGRLTLRQRDPDFARLRNFTSASRTWVDLRATHGSERTASLSPAGPNTYVWSASCPASLLASRGLQESDGASAYWRCLAMFEDFPQDFFAALRATAGSAVVEVDTYPAPAPAAATGLAAPWRWFSGGGAALVGDAVYCLPVDDASSTAINLALEDAAVLGVCTAQHGLTARALQEYARSRGPRVSSLLALPPSAPERARMRDAPFLPTLSPPPPPPPQSVSGSGPDAAADVSSLSNTVASAVDSAAAAAVAVTSPTQPLEELLVRAAVAAVAAAAAADPGSGPPGFPASSALLPGSRPSGGASRGLPLTTPAALPPLPSPAGPSSPLFSRPSGARRLGPMVPVAIAAMINILAARARAAAAAEATVADVVAPLEIGADVSNEGDAPVSTTAPPAAASVLPSRITLKMTVDASPRGVWESLLRSHGSVPAAAAAATSAREYCSIGTPAAVWQALLVAPAKAHDMLVTLPYDAAESPALVWMALLGTHAAAVVPASAVAPAAGSSAFPVSPCTLLPRPVLKQKSAAAASAAATVAASAATEPAPAFQPEATSTISMTEAISAPLPPSPSQPRQAPPPALSSGPAAGSGSDQQQRRRLRSQAAGPVSGRWAGGDRRGSGGGAKMTGANKARRATAASASRATDAAATAPAATAASTAATPAAVASRAKAARAQTAAKVTASLSAAAALGGVIGAAGTGHMPMMDMAAALSAHSGTVAQFWDDLNNLTMSSASLSSIDMS